MKSDLERILHYFNNTDTSAYEVAKATGLTESGIGKILNGVSKNPRKKTIDLLLSYFEKDSNADNYSVSDNNSSLYDQLVNSNGNKFFEKPDGSFDIEVNLIPFDAYASYLESLEEASVHEDFEKVVFNVDRYGRGNYKAFKIKGESMNSGMIDDVPDGALVLAREIGRHHWKDGFHDAKHGFIILCKDSIYHKDIVDFNKESGDIVCESRNNNREFVKQFSINLNEVYQIFRIIKRQM
ncbi:helix-turn-helix domain-containing protein [Leeuwenhoekiella sp. ZYFB001]|uniref:helix-turn-helix domain-containing protein n=1 Tax=Leeuwenhoekiella sp. ZYFB001 TaxID=2719912 RepID=UPI001431C358|nr:helix-turn-helix domain-containing protein [Leeuwenhoekiella sp. ZYFB001]